MKIQILFLLALLPLISLFAEIEFNYEYQINETEEIKTYWLDEYENEECLFYLTQDGSNFKIKKAGENPITIAEHDFSPAASLNILLTPLDFNNQKLFIATTQAYADTFYVDFLNRADFSTIDSLIIDDLEVFPSAGNHTVHRRFFEADSINLFGNEYIYFSWYQRIPCSFDEIRLYSKSALISLQNGAEVLQVFADGGNLINKSDNSLLIQSFETFMTNLDDSTVYEKNEALCTIDFVENVANYEYSDVLSLSGSCVDFEDYSTYPDHVFALNKYDWNIEDSYIYMRIYDEDYYGLLQQNIYKINSNFEIEYGFECSHPKSAFFPNINGEQILATSNYNEINFYNQATGANLFSIDIPLVFIDSFRKQDGSHLFRTNSNEVYSLPANLVDNEESTNQPTISKLSNYPNPFNPTTKISYELIEDYENVNLKIYDIKGRLVKGFSNAEQSKGTHEVVWSGKDNHNNEVSSGVYFYRLSVNGNTIAENKMLLLK